MSGICCLSRRLYMVGYRRPDPNLLKNALLSWRL
ncbi:unnamed protein product [Brassica rapa subsp. trilocularis]